MNNKLRLALIQMHVEAGNPDANFEAAAHWLAQVVSAPSKPDLIMLPEMWNTGYAWDRIGDIADPAGSRTSAFMADFCRKHQVTVLAGSIAEKHPDGKVTNTIHVFGPDGKECASYSKIHLFRLMNEHLHLKAGEKTGQFELSDIPAAAMICYDIRFPELARKLALAGARILFVPAQWPNPRMHHWRTLLQARAIENQMFVAACNTVGESGGTSFFGHSMIIDPWGEVLAEAGEEETVLSAEIDLSLVTEVRGRIPVFEDRRPHLYV
jgi:predicted amidohydrolase